MSGAGVQIALSKAPNDGVTATNLSANETESFDRPHLPQYVQSHDGARWVWDDTRRWYPGLLASGVRIRQCADLRLRHNILRNSPLIDQSGMNAGWDIFEIDNHEPGLFAAQFEPAPLDPIEEYARQEQALQDCAESKALQLLLMAESAAALVAAEMSFVGLPWRADIHNQLLAESLGTRPHGNARPSKLAAMVDEIRLSLNAPNLNPDSPQELLRALQLAGMILSDTRSWTLRRLEHPVIPLLVEYKKLQRLHNNNGWRWLDTWVHEGRYRTTYVPGGVVTGRWAATGGGALSLPAQLRPAVVADDGWTFVTADVAQLEPRVLAAMSGDTAMADAARGVDLYQNLVDARVVDTREHAKLGMLGAMYGATQGQSRQMVARLSEHFPTAFNLVESAARAGERGDVVRTFLGRGSPEPSSAWDIDIDGTRETQHQSSSRSWGRFTRNFIVQGTGAEWALCWMALLRNDLWELVDTGTIAERPHLVFFLHDEIIVHTPVALANDVAQLMQHTANKATSLLFRDFPIDFPLNVKVVKHYSDAKNA